MTPHHSIGDRGRRSERRATETRARARTPPATVAFHLAGAVGAPVLLRGHTRGVRSNSERDVSFVARVAARSTLASTSRLAERATLTSRRRRRARTARPLQHGSPAAKRAPTCRRRRSFVVTPIGSDRRDRKVYCDRSDTRRRELKAIRDMRAVRAMRGSGRRGRDVEALVSVRDQVFGAHDAGLAKALLLPSLTRRPGAAAAVVVWAGQIPIAGARVEFTMAATSPACRAAARCRPGAGVVCSAPWWPIGLSRVGEGLPLSPGRRCPRLPTDPSGHWGSSCLPLRPRPRIQAEQADVAVAVPDRTRRTAAGGDYLRWRAGGWSADPRPFPDDPKVVRLRLKPIHGCGDVALWRCCRPPLAYALDLAAALQVLRAGERVVAVEACRAGGHRRRE
jgi:hypothetical protein